MAYEQAQREALRILEGIENGTMSAAESSALIDDADPALVYLILTWIRARYPASHAASEAVIGRLVTLTERYPSVTKKMAEGKADSIIEWFEDAYSYRDLDSKAFIALVVDKLES
jgi:hypothetical protein